MRRHIDTRVATDPLGKKRGSVLTRTYLLEHGIGVPSGWECGLGRDNRWDTRPCYRTPRGTTKRRDSSTRGQANLHM